MKFGLILYIVTEILLAGTCSSLYKQIKYFIIEIADFVVVIDTVELQYLYCCLPTRTLLEDDNRFDSFHFHMNG